MTEIILQTLNHQDMDWLQSTGTPHQLKVNQALSDRNTCHLILEGKLSVRPNPNQSLNYLSQGDILGITSQDWGDRTTVQAIGNTLLLAIPKPEIRQKLQDDPSFAAHLYQAQALLLTRRLKRLMGQLDPDDLAYQPQRESVTVFSGLQDSDLDWIITVGKVQSIPPNTYLLQGNSPIDAMHILLDGVCVVELDEDRRSPLLKAFSKPGEEEPTREELARLSRGDLIGETALVNANPMNIVVRTVRESKVLSIPRWRIAAKLLHDIEFASRFYQVLATILTNQQNIILQNLGQETDLDESEDQSDHEFLNKVALAEARFEWMLKRIQSELGTGREIQW
jgi:CRP-like cAMP-binding protein